MRKAFLLSVGLAALGGGAAAQSLREIQARNAAAHALEDVRRDLLANQIEASNAQERARTQALLRDLATGRGEAGLGSLPLTAPAIRTPDPASGTVDLSASMDRLDRLTQDALAESNARMRAIRPASEPRKD
ncbi:hypothetical protein [Caulobacter sp.]|uniref:hypothetical protein n=1 Tax=Caulobacter sp. TaxID=78 RepID=UPI002B49B261|nr:hypothetical protein [Caulobacter sp.]HJV42032.1 hypothetical protein [Caulobacter sp.]